MTMRPLNCQRCGIGVLVEKFSPVHTSIQWTSDAAGCPVISAGNHGVGDQGRGCGELRRSINNAVNDGALTETRIELPTDSTIPRLH